MQRRTQHLLEDFLLQPDPTDDMDDDDSASIG